MKTRPISRVLETG